MTDHASLLAGRMIGLPVVAVHFVKDYFQLQLDSCMITFLDNPCILRSQTPPVRFGQSTFPYAAVQLIGQELKGIETEVQQVTLEFADGTVLVAAYTRLAESVTFQDGDMWLALP